MNGFVYVPAVDFVALANDVVEHLRRGRAYLADQLQRAATSVQLNIAEGSSLATRRRASTASPGGPPRSAPPHSTFASAKDLVEPPRYQAGWELLLRIVAMLVQMVRRAEESGTGTGSGSGTK